MKKVLKRVVSLILSMILVLGVWQTPVYASGIDDNGQGNVGGGGSLSLNGKDGINPFKAGWLLWVSDESGHPILGKPVTAISAGGYQPTSTSGAVRTKRRIGSYRKESPSAVAIPSFPLSSRSCHPIFNIHML